MRSVAILVLATAFVNLRSPANVTAPALEPSAVNASEKVAAKPDAVVKVEDAKAAVAAKPEVAPVAEPEVAKALVAEPEVAKATVVEPEVEGPGPPKAAKKAKKAAIGDAKDALRDAKAALVAAKPEVAEAPVAEPEVATANATEPVSLANATANATGAGFAAHAEAPVPVTDEPAPKAASKEAMEALAEAKDARVVTDEPSAADVYMHVNMMLNRMNAEARGRAHQAEEAAKAPVAAKPEVTHVLVAAKPEVAKAPVAEPEVAKAPVAEPEVAKAPVAEPEVAKAPVAEQEVAKAPVAEPEVAKAPVAKPEPKAAKKAEKAMEPKVEPLSIEEKREQEFPTDWIKNDVKFNVDKDEMQNREDSVEQAVIEQQAWSKRQGESWIQAKKLRGA